MTAGRISVQLVLGHFLVGVDPCVLFTDWTAMFVWQNVELLDMLWYRFLLPVHLLVLHLLASSETETSAAIQSLDVSLINI